VLSDKLLVAEAVDRSDLPSPQRNFRVTINGTVMLLDLAWPEFRYSVDLDGATFHADRFDQDRERDVLLRTGGWTIDRFTWTHATTRMPWLLHTVRTRLTERSWKAA
jgi:very-short-patch-repair endonuclease